MASAVYGDAARRDLVVGLADRMEQPLRVVIAGKVKAGKSTLLNALVGERLAPTDASECTKVVTWYIAGPTYKATLHPYSGGARTTTYERGERAVHVDLGGYSNADISRIELEWPSKFLASMTVIDSPGIGGMDRAARENLKAFLDRNEERPADAVIYLLRHVHPSDFSFLESFQDSGYSDSSPVNSIGVLSRADDLGAGRLDALDTAEKICSRYRADDRLRRLCQTVIPVAGLIAEAGTTLLESHYRTLRRIAGLPDDDRRTALLSADHYATVTLDGGPTTAERIEVIERLGLFGIRTSVEWLRAHPEGDSSGLASYLVEMSGLPDLRKVIEQYFGARADLLKSRSVLTALESLARRVPVPGSEALVERIEQIRLNSHEFEQVKVLNAVMTGTTKLKDREEQELRRLLGRLGGTERERLGLDESASYAEAAAVTADLIAYWRKKAESPLSDSHTRDAARTIVRTYEDIYADLRAGAAGDGDLEDSITA